MHPIPDKAEVAIDFPEKFYMGSFGRDSRFEVRAEDEDVLIRLSRTGEKRDAQIHLHYALFADILDELARSLRQRSPLDDSRRQHLLTGARSLSDALEQLAYGR